MYSALSSVYPFCCKILTMDTLCFFVFLDTFTGQSGDTEKPGLNIFLLCFRIRKRLGFIRFVDTFKLQRSLNLICNQVNNGNNNKKSDLSKLQVNHEWLKNYFTVALLSLPSSPLSPLNTSLAAFFARRKARILVSDCFTHHLLKNVSFFSKHVSCKPNLMQSPV